MDKNENAIGVVLLKEVIQIGNLYRVEIIQIKSHIEVAIGIVCVFLMFNGGVAPIFPIFYWQYLRIKYVVNYFTRQSFHLIDDKILRTIFPGMLYSLIVDNGKKALFYFVNYKSDNTPKNSEDLG